MSPDPAKNVEKNNPPATDAAADGKIINLQNNTTTTTEATHARHNGGRVVDVNGGGGEVELATIAVDPFGRPSNVPAAADVRAPFFHTLSSGITTTRRRFDRRKRRKNLRRRRRRRIIVIRGNISAFGKIREFQQKKKKNKLPSAKNEKK